MPDPGGLEAGHHVARQVEHGMAGPGRRNEEFGVGWVGGQEAVHQLLADLIVRLADHRTGRGDHARPVGAEFFHRRKRRFDHAAEGAAPAGMGRAEDARLRVREQDRAAVGGGDADGEAGNLGDDGVGFRAFALRPRLLGDHHVGRMDLVGGEEVLRLNADGGGHARAVLGDVLRLVVRTGAAVEAFIDAARHAAVAGEEGVADAVESFEVFRFQHSEPRQWAELRIGEGCGLEQLPHAGAAFAGQALHREVDVAGLLRRRVCLQCRGTVGEAERAEECGLLDRAVGARAHALDRKRESGEVHMRGEIDLTGRRQRAGEGVRADRLQRVADGALDVAVVDDERCAARLAVRHDAAAELEREAVAAPFVDRADRRIAHRLRQELLEQRQGIVADAEGEVAIDVELDRAFVPAVELLHRLMHRQRVEEFVGDDDERAVRHLVERVVPVDRHVDTAERLLLPLLKHRARLDHVHDDGVAEFRQNARGAQHVHHHGAAAGAKLDKADVLRRAHLAPDRCAPDADQLAEHLAYLGGGDEIAVAPERIARHVVAVPGIAQAQRHELAHRHRPAALDALPDFSLERGVHRFQACGNGGRLEAQTISAIPISISGTDSSMPMVMPPHKKPSCASGSRKNSQNVRAIP